VRVIEPEIGVPAEIQGASIALGNFDGMHKGHQAVLDAARAAAGGATPLGMAVFDPHPRRFFQPHAAPFRILSDTTRNHVLADLGVDVLYRIGFDRALSLMDDRAFAADVLVGALGIAHVTVGWDFRFGKDRVGSTDSLKALGEEFGFGVTIVEQVSLGGEDCSSSAIRAAIAKGDMAAAEKMLTRPWVVDGVVERGDQRGRELGFPTANLYLGDLIRPPVGVYAVTVRIEGEDRDRPGAAYIGWRPTFEGEDERLEAYLFDFEGDLYGRHLAVAPRAFLRGDMKFDSAEALTAQMDADVAAARAALDALGSS
jgi:riboflavin kinase/FMN adenylyltransferase